MLYQKVLDFICQKLLENNFHFLPESTCRLHEETADVFGEISISELVLELTGNGCEVRSMQEHDENLESFYRSLIGGKGHA